MASTLFNIVTLPKYGRNAHDALCTDYLPYVVNRHPAIYVIWRFGGEKNGKMKIVSSFSSIKLCFVINVLNNKTVIPLSLAEYGLILANSAYGLIA